MALHETQQPQLVSCQTAFNISWLNMQIMHVLVIINKAGSHTACAKRAFHCCQSLVPVPHAMPRSETCAVSCTVSP